MIIKTQNGQKMPKGDIKIRIWSAKVCIPFDKMDKTKK